MTKYAQSCLVVETDDGARLLVDAGFHTTRRSSLEQLGTIDAALYTHRHPDHLDLAWVGPLLDAGVVVHGNADVLTAIREEDASLDAADGLVEVTPGTPFTAAGVTVDPYDLPHMPLVDGRPGPPNTGFLIGGRLLHPGDARELPDLPAEALAVPIAGPSTSARHAYLMVEAARARTAVPIHHDHFLADPQLFADQCPIAEVVVLGHGETHVL